MNWADSQCQATISAALESNNIHASLPMCPTSLPNTGPQASPWESRVFTLPSLAHLLPRSPTIPEMCQKSGSRCRICPAVSRSPKILTPVPCISHG